MRTSNRLVERGWGARSNNASVGLALALAALTAQALPAEAQDRVVIVHDHGPRLRFGASGVGGGFVGAVHGGAGGLALRIGVQFTDVVAIYLQGQALLGAFLPEPPPTSSAASGFVFHELMLDLTFFDVLQVGAGPSLDFVWGCSTENRGAVCARQGPFFGGDLRVAVVLGSRGPGRRGGVSFSVDAHPTWLDSDVATMLLFGIGGELY